MCLSPLCPAHLPKLPLLVFLTPNAKGCCWVLRMEAPRQCHPRGWPTPPEAALVSSPNPVLNINAACKQPRLPGDPQRSWWLRGCSVPHPRIRGGSGGQGWCRPHLASSSPQVGGDRTGGAVPVLDVQKGGRLHRMYFGALHSSGPWLRQAL